MNTTNKPSTTDLRLMWLTMALALLAALGYVMIASRVLAVGDLRLDQESGAIIYVAAGGYLLGGLLILLRRRWLWIVGVGVNTLVLLFFFQMYQNRPAVVFSPGGLVSKAAQLLLEVSLIYLIITDWRHWRRQ